MLAQFGTMIEMITSENVNPAGEGFRPSRYRMVPEEEPDSGLEGLYFVDLPSTDGKEPYFGTGRNIWRGDVTVQLGFARAGGDAGSGDRASVRDTANDDCMKVSDVCENPLNYDAQSSGIRIIKYRRHARSFDGKRSEVWTVTFAVEWESDVIVQ
jgi:hypothetical protein